MKATGVCLCCKKRNRLHALTKNHHYHFPLQKNGKGIKLVHGEDVIFMIDG